MQSPSWAANWFAASQEIPRISRNPKVHYRTHKRPPPVSILGQPNYIYVLQSINCGKEHEVLHLEYECPVTWKTKAQMVE